MACVKGVSKFILYLKDYESVFVLNFDYGL